MIVYDQDATRSRGFILVKLGAPLLFHYMLYTVFPIRGYMDSYLNLFQDIIQKRFLLKRYICHMLTSIVVEYMRKICCTTTVMSSQVYNRFQMPPYAEGCRGVLF